MGDLTPEEIALGLRAAKVWAWEAGDIARAKVGDDVGPRFCVTGLKDVLSDDVIPDPTHRGFVSAALAQVRARTDRWWHVQATDGRRWHLCDEDGFVKTMPSRSYPSEAEAVVAALEATR